MAVRLRCLVGLFAVTVAAAVCALPANAGLLGTGQASYCAGSAQTFGQWNDSAYYMLTPGGSFEPGSPAWSLSGGAKIVSGNESYYLNSRYDSHSLYMPSGSKGSTPTMCFAAGDFHLRFVGKGSGRIHVTITVNSLLGVLSILDGGTVQPGGAWSPSPEVSLLLSQIGGALTTKAISLNFAVSGGSAQIDDVYLDPFKDT